MADVNPRSPRKGTDTKPNRRVKPSHIKHDAAGGELMDPLPIAPPLGYKKQPSLKDQIRAMVISEKLRVEAETAGYETFDEADDFDIGDDFDPRSPYEEIFEPLPEPADRYRELGNHIGEAIMSKLGGDTTTLQREGGRGAPAPETPEGPAVPRAEPVVDPPRGRASFQPKPQK